MFSVSRVFAQSNQSLLTRIGNLVFWSAVVDMLWRAATNQFSNGGKGGRTTNNTARQRLHRTEKVVTFETAVVRASTPLKLVWDGVMCGSIIIIK